MSVAPTFSKETLLAVADHLMEQSKEKWFKPGLGHFELQEAALFLRQDTPALLTLAKQRLDAGDYARYPVMWNELRRYINWAEEAMLKHSKVIELEERE